MVLKDKLDLEKFEKYFENLKLTLNSGKIVTFLDLNISYNENTKKLNYSVHIKPTNNFGYLRTSSNHPSHIYKNIPWNLFLRNKKISSMYFDYVNISKIQICHLEKRGYNRLKLIKLCKKKLVI